MTEVSNERLAWCLILAAIFHLALMVLKVPAHSLGILEKAELPPIEVETLDNTRKPVVQTSKALEQADPKKESRFAGEFQNRVDEETQAARMGRFEAGKAGQATPELPLENEGEPTKEPSMRDLMALGSQPHDLPNDIKKGGATLLNTDKVLYASFINRVADEIYDVWVENAQEAVKELYRRGRKLDENIYITKVKVVLDKIGEVKAIQIIQSSGVLELDEAPKKAFWDREPFRNPPSQMFEADGFARFTYEFHFEWKSSSFNIVPWEI